VKGDDAAVIMENYVKVSKEVFAPIVELFRIGLFKDERDALTGIIREQARNKIQYYGGKVSELERKYKVDFREFKRFIEGREGEEVFEDGMTSYSGRAMKRRCDTGLMSRRGGLLRDMGMMLWIVPWGEE
jgi:hypothetical protein